MGVPSLPEISVPDFDWNAFAQHGIAGLILLVLLIVLITSGRERKQTMKMHVDSSERWRQSFENVAERQDRTQSETNEVLRGMSRAIEKNTVRLNQHERFNDKLTG